MRSRSAAQAPRT